MAKIVQRAYDLTVNTWADLQALPSIKKKDGAKITVLDAIGDTRTVGGTVIYQYITAFAGTVDEWMIVGGTDEAIKTVHEDLIITNGQVTLSNIPNNNVLFDVQAKWTENGQEFVEDVSYSCEGNIVSVSTYYDGKTLSVSYLKNESGKLYQLGDNVGVSSFNDLTDKPTTVAGYGITDAYTKTEVNTSLDSKADKVSTYTKTEVDGLIQNVDLDLSNISQNILPSASSTYNIGSATNRFKSIYVDEAYLSTNTLYIGDTPVLGTNQDTILIKADVDQSITMASYGTGATTIQSASGVNLITSGMNADVKVQAVGTNSKVRLAGSGGIELSDPTSIQSNLSVSGGLTVTGNVTLNGSAFTVNSTTVTTADNIIVLNNGEVGNGVTAGRAGIKIDRGDAADYELVFDETDDKFKVGQVGGTYETLASREYVSSYTPSYSTLIDKPTTISGYGITDAYTKTEVDSKIGVSIQGYNANTVIDAKYVHTDNNYTTADKSKLAGVEVGATADQTPAEIKAAYESNANTNAFTDAEKAKLANLSGDFTLPVASANALGGVKSGTDITVDANGNVSVKDNSHAHEIANVTGLQSALDSKLEAETLTSLKLVGNNLTYKDETGTDTTIDLSAYLDEDARAIASGTLNSTSGVVTFTRDNNTTFTLDLSALLDDTNLVTSVAGKSGVVTLTKSDVGLSNVDNTSDLAKPISTATQAALNDKSATTHKHTGVYEPADSTIVKDANYVHTDNNFTTLEKNKLSSLVNYSLPIASDSVLGGIKVGSGLSIDANGVVSATAQAGGQYLGTATMKAIAYNAKSVVEDIVVQSNMNALAAGPIDISNGSITIQEGGRLVIV